MIFGLLNNANRNMDLITNALITCAAIFCMSLFVLMGFTIYNSTGSRANVLKIQSAKADLLIAKASYYNARANSIEYLNKCTPESDALHDIAEAIETASENAAKAASSSGGAKGGVTVSPKVNTSGKK